MLGSSSAMGRGTGRRRGHVLWPTAWLPLRLRQPRKREAGTRPRPTQPQRPPKCSTIWRLIGRPRPVPWGRFSASPPWRNFSNTSCCCSPAHARGRCPAPRRVAPAHRRQAHRRPSAPAGNELRGVGQQVESTCSSRSASARSVRGTRSGRHQLSAALAEHLGGGLRRLAAQRSEVDVGDRHRRCRTRSWPCRAPG